MLFLVRIYGCVHVYVCVCVLCTCPQHVELSHETSQHQILKVLNPESCLKNGYVTPEPKSYDPRNPKLIDPRA